MAVELKIPEVGESIAEVGIGEWLKKEGDVVRKDEPVVTLESEKATVELPAPESGTLSKVMKKAGDSARVGEVIALIEKNGAPAPTLPPAPAKETTPATPHIMPAADRLLAENQLSPKDVEGTGPGGRILKEDVQRRIDKKPVAPASPPSTESKATTPAPQTPKAQTSGSREEEVVPMTRLRRTVAERLVQAQQSAALLTTFNEIDMGGVMALRKDYGEAFQQKYNVKLGFMSFFVKAAVDGLKQFPLINAEIQGTNIVFHNYFDIGIAIGGGKGLVVPVLRNAERMSFAEIELAIGEYAKRAKENKIKPEDLEGGTFTISNGGVYGSLLSTPIVNPPQSGVLGLHTIQDRPVAREGNVVVRPMMYVALTYDHRIVDGREAVGFVKRIKELIEAPTRMLMEV